jgi:hypothetical protein
VWSCAGSEYVPAVWPVDILVGPNCHSTPQSQPFSTEKSSINGIEYTGAGVLVTVGELVAVPAISVLVYVGSSVGVSVLSGKGVSVYEGVCVNVRVSTVHVWVGDAVSVSVSVGVYDDVKVTVSVLLAVGVAVHVNV